VALGVLTLLVLRSRGQARELAKVGGSPDDVLVLYRHTLERRISRLSRMRRVLPVIGVMELTLVHPGAPWPRSLDRTGMVLFAVGVSLFCFGQAVYLSRKMLPALRHELEALRA
jgi:hypothetical protein